MIFTRSKIIGSLWSPHLCGRLQTPNTFGTCSPIKSRETDMIWKPKEARKGKWFEPKIQTCLSAIQWSELVYLFSICLVNEKDS